MKIKLTWDEFVGAAITELRNHYDIKTIPQFWQRNSYEPDSECYTFPPAYVEIECEEKKVQ